VADVDAPLEQNILDLSQRQRIADIHHHREADHLGRAVEITKRIAHRRRLRNLARRLKPIYSDNAITITHTPLCGRRVACRGKFHGLLKLTSSIFNLSSSCSTSTLSPVMRGELPIRYAGAIDLSVEHPSRNWKSIP